jgi:inner membrane protein
MKTNYYLKLVMITLLIFALFIPQAYLKALVSERTSWRQQAYQSIEQSWPGAQTLSGPVLVVPYRLIYHSTEKVITAKKAVKQIIQEHTLDSNLYLIPKQLHINSTLDSSLRYRGIYGVPVYSNQLQVSGEFNTQPLLDLLAQNKNDKITWGKPQLSLLVADQRGIAAPPALNWNGNTLSFLPNANMPNAIQGMHAELPVINVDKPIALAFNFAMELRGMQAMNFALLSENTDIQTSANWADPSFTGEQLPEQRDITEHGFTALWRASAFSHNVSGVLDRCKQGECNALLENAVGFELVQPVDIYQQSERSIKYAALFIFLTFAVLMLFELIKKLRIHPIQYSLVGMALLMFYLLLVSLSEHIAFLWAFAIGAFASTSLLTLYFGGILRSHKLGFILGSGLSILYALLYVILQSEQNSLLMGSVLLFCVLAIMMLATRNLDWYALTAQDQTGFPKLFGKKNPEQQP